MNKHFFRLYILGFVLLSDFRMFALDDEEPGDTDPGGTLEDEDGPTLPINSKLIYLALIGIVFAFYMYRRHKELNTK